MNIQDLFERDIHRSINGVVKADQLDASSIWQELDEFVVTRELAGHINALVATMLSTIQSESDAAGKNGIWVSGFFGSGKSHFIKVLSYLLENGEHSNDGESKRAVDFFQDKFADAMLFADLKKVVAANTDTILFNIDTKADHRTGRDTLLQVFLKVLNEKQGYSGDHPHVAHMERFLDEKGKLSDFHEAFEKAAGSTWHQERDAWEFHRDEVIAALQTTLGQSAESVSKWVDNEGENFSLTVENFAKWVSRYIDGNGPDHRIMFLVDEVGQFVGRDTHLMLSLQTITEQLGTVCSGRAWVVVTSQENLDAVLGEMGQTKEFDFSKIQGRFKTRLSLSSGNVDEVIKKRLLAKKAEAADPLAVAYEGKHDILKNQLSFMKAGMSFRAYEDGADFAACYPFAAYQFALVQKVFESIRRAGATGVHLAQGERSNLDAFQSAARDVGSKPIGALVPFYGFYPAVEGFLEGAVKRTIDQAGDSHALEPFDSTLLKLQFLIRYVEELPGTVDNLVTLCVDEIDTDKLALRKTIEESLARLEQQTLIARNGDLYFFLTNEERDVGRDIKNEKIPSGSEERELGKLIFEDILGDVRKHTYSLTGKDFPFTRICDDHAVGNKLEGSLEVSVVSPLGDSYLQFTEDAACVLHSAVDGGKVLIRLPDSPLLRREIRTYLQTDSYVKTKHTGTLPDTTKRILRDRVDDNRARRVGIVETLRGLFTEASYFASGQPLDIQRTDAKAALSGALEYLIRNAFPKMGYIRQIHPNPKHEIQSTLRANDVDQVALKLDGPDSNNEALDDLREYVKLSTMTSKQIVLGDLINKRYAGRPYGWHELEVVLLVARLAVHKEIELLVESKPLRLDDAYDHLTSSSKQRHVVITLRESADSGLLKEAQKLGKELFAQAGTSTEAALFSSLKAHLTSWNTDLASYQPLAKTGKYPGLEEIESHLTFLRKFVKEENSLTFLRWFVENKSQLLERSESVHELQGFYTNQRHSWESLRTAFEELSQNRLQLETDAASREGLQTMEEILRSDRPYSQLHSVAALVHSTKEVNDRLVEESRAPVVSAIQAQLAGVQVELDKVKAEPALRTAATSELERLLATAKKATSIAHITQARQTAEDAFERALLAIERACAAPPSGPGSSPAPAPKTRRVLEPSAMWPTGFIETPADVEAFLSKLRTALEAAVASDERVQIK
tara:strand:+ start:1250 stop:4816 length:3567 start_codon:yes stop_codon:yes gene_type:complete